MTNYITAAGVQQFSITIASGSTTGTATISAVGSGAYIIYGGINPSVSANPSEDFAYLALTNSTTITATRNTGTTGTVIITGSIVDGDTTNLIKSVQYGTVSISAGTSGTASISAVTNANAATHFLGNDITATSGSATVDFVRVSLSSTTVTAAVASSNTSVVGFVVVEFQGSCLTANAVQNLTASSASGVTSFNTALTNNVVLANAVSFYGGFNIATTSTNLNLAMLYGSLSGVGTFTVNDNSANSQTKTYNVSIAEFNSGILNSSVQRSTTTLTGVTSNTATLTSVNATYAGLNWLGNTTSASSFLLNEAAGNGVLTNSTTVTVTKNTATANITGSWEVFEFPAFSGGGGTFNPGWTYGATKTIGGVF